MHPSREEFSELIYYISELKHTFTHKIDEQSTKINEQSIVIEELLWQIRELSDKIRQLNQWKNDVERVISDSRRKFDDMSKNSTCVCRYENHIPKNRILNNRQSSNASSRNHHSQLLKQLRVGKKNGSHDKIDGRDTDDDVYETIEFSDSSHIYTEPVRNTEQNEYGALRKIHENDNENVKMITSSPSPVVASKRTSVINRKPTSSTNKVGLKKSTRTRNLQKFPAMQDVSKVASSDSEVTVGDEKVELRAKSQRNSRRGNSKQVCALVSDIERARDHISEQFIQPRDVSGLLINFDCLRSRVQREEINRKTSL